MRTIVVEKSKKTFDAIYTICLNSQAIFTYILACHNNGIVNYNISISIPRGNNKKTLYYDPKQLSESFINGSIPESLTFYEKEEITNYAELEKPEILSFDVSTIRRQNLQGIFIDFYEKNKPNSIQLKDWSNPWKFAWVIRNAFAHGGSISWRDERITEVNWDNFIYKRENDNDRNIIFIDFGEADIMLLLLDLD